MSFALNSAGGMTWRDELRESHTFQNRFPRRSEAAKSWRDELRESHFPRRGGGREVFGGTSSASPISKLAPPRIPIHRLFTPQPRFAHDVRAYCGLEAAIGISQSERPAGPRPPAAPSQLCIVTPSCAVGPCCRAALIRARRREKRECRLSLR